MTPQCQTIRFSHLPMMLLALFALALQGCGDGVRILPPAQSDVDPAGYYTNTGTASVDNGAVGTIDITDLQAMVDGNQIMMMSTAEGLLYDGTITSINGDDFTADFTIYTDGDNPISATASGTITEGSSITGTLTGSGVGSGTFILTYAMSNNQAADLARIKDRFWDGDGAVGPNYVFSIDAQGALTSQLAANFNVLIFDGCEINGTVAPISGTSLYEVAATLTSCDEPAVDNTNYTGFAVSRTDSVADDTLVLVLSNGTYSPNGELIVN